jgi:hypothetical protein
MAINDKMIFENNECLKLAKSCSPEKNSMLPVAAQHDKTPDQIAGQRGCMH